MRWNWRPLLNQFFITYQLICRILLGIVFRGIDNNTSIDDIFYNTIASQCRDPLNSESPPPLVGFLTYNSKIQIYDIINNGHSHIICDVSSTFPPLTTFLVDPLVHFEQIDRYSYMMAPTGLYISITCIWWMWNSTNNWTSNTHN